MGRKAIQGSWEGKAWKVKEVCVCVRCETQQVYICVACVCEWGKPTDPMAGRSLAQTQIHTQPRSEDIMYNMRGNCWVVKSSVHGK